MHDALASVLAIAVLMAAAASCCLFLLADRDKAENAAQVSSSRWGYQVLIPVYGITVYAILVGSFVVGGWYPDALFYTILVAVVAFVLYFAYRRSFRLKKWDIIMVAVILAAGFLLAYLLYGIDVLILRLSEEIDLLSVLSGSV